MDNRHALLAAFVCAGSTLACGSADTSFSTARPVDGGSGASASGGMTASNGGSSNGGTGAGTGGTATGGATATGGTTTTGGAAATGGATMTGGASNGGAAGAGGATTSGGAGGAATGGAAPTGGTTGTGGAVTGGTTSTGGAGGVGGGTPGSYVSGTVGDDSNPGTQSLPVQTIAKGIANARTLGGVPVFVAEGHYPEKVTLVEGIDMLGGHQCDLDSCTWAYDPVAHDTAILDQDAEGLLADDTITRTTTIDGFRIMGQNGGAAGRGRASITLRGGSPTITNNRIFGPNTTGGTGAAGRSIGVVIFSPTNSLSGPLIEGNDIGGGQASDQSFGIAFDTPSFPSPGPTTATVRRNVIRGGTGTGSAAINATTSGAGTLIEDNDIRTGSATNFSAWAITVASQLTITANRINVGNTTVACQPGNQSPCGGINSISSTSSITNNVIFGVDAPRSIGVRLTEAEIPSGLVVLNANTIDGGGTPSNSGSGTSTSVALLVEIGACTTCGFNGFVGHVRNNILLGGVANAKFAIYEQAPAGRTQHPDILENNDLFLTAPSSANDALYRYFDGTNSTLITTIGSVNGLQSQVARMTVGSNISADPQLDASFNLTGGSLCIDAGTSTEAPAVDKNGLARPQNGVVDIGADEL